MTLAREIGTITRSAKAASRLIYHATARVKAGCLLDAARGLWDGRQRLLAENRKDLMAARRAGLRAAMIERLTLTPARVRSMAAGLREVARQKDYSGLATESRRRPNGLLISKVRVPIGVVLIIYESRPNVTADAAALCLKSGNAVILRGGREALHANRAIVRVFQQALRRAGLPVHGVQLIQNPDRRAVAMLVRESGNIDLAIPRGGEGLIRSVAAAARIPVLKHYKGVCHVFVDHHADVNMARKIAVNAKVQRPSVCNAMETLLLDQGLSRRAMVSILSALRDKGVTLRGCQKTRRIFPSVLRATEADYSREYLDLTLSVKVVGGLDAAMDHIAQYGSAHTDAIVTNNERRARTFLSQVDSSSVMWNASTRFSDGAQYGLGAEIGISTDKLHARGPMGAYDLTTYKWVVAGKGQVRT
jgi:glutamate-5-semialdehyde dehydrogenase